MHLRRRTFLKSLGASALLTPSVVPAQTLTPLPSSIAKLTSMRSSVKPISRAEREERIAKAQALMKANKLDAILLAGGTSLFYFTGVHWGNSERLFAFVFPVSGKGLCVCPSFEEGRAREQMQKGPFGKAELEILTWHEDDNPYAILASGLKNRGLSTAALGIEESMPFVFSDGVAQATPGLSLKTATPVTAGCRAIKSAHELELMGLANRATLAVYKAVYQALKPGMTQDDAGSLISAAYRQVGFEGDASVQVGAYSALPHGSVTPQIIKEGTVVMLDDGCTVEGYNSDITRTFVLGKATDKMKRVFDIVQRAQQAALTAAKPGAPCGSVDAAARRVVSESGFGPGYKNFTHRLGHGIGLDGHEWPYLVRGNDLPLAPGMTFSDEPGIYIPGEFGIRLEDDMHISESGAQLFTEPSKSIEAPFD